MKKIIYSLAITATTIAMTNCTDKDNIINEILNQNEKDMISFSLSDEASRTRAGFTGADTHLAMRIQSNEKNGSGVKYTRTSATAAKDANPSTDTYSTVSFTNDEMRYWDDAHGRKSLLSVFAVAVPNGSSTIKNNNKSLIDLLAKGDNSATWGTVDNNTIEWVVTYGTTDGKDQKKDASTVTTPASSIDMEDLVYSNNIQADANLGKDGIYRWDYTQGKHLPDATGATTHKNGQMLFYQQAMTDDNAATTAPTDAPGHFDKGHLVFNHALSRISVKLVAGTGFTKAAAGSFDLTAAGVQFLNMNVKGKLNIPTGVWTADGTTPTGTIVTKPARKTTNDGATPTPAITSMYYETVAQMLPGYVFIDGNNTNVFQFTIDNNTYFITQDMLFDALVAVNDNQTDDRGYTAGTAEVPESTPGANDGHAAVPGQFEMKQGRNYSFEITINKKQIEAITATLKAWDDVSAEFAQDNTHITVSTSSTGSEHNDFNLFRLEQTLDKIYTDDTYAASAYSGNYKANGVATLAEMFDPDNSNASYSPKRWMATGTDWYYKDNMTAYHLRTLNDLAADEGGNDDDDKTENVANTTDPAKSYFKMKNGAQATQDYHWGAPMTTNANLKYGDSSKDGYTTSIHKGFVAPANKAANPINITELHMMSNINVILKTTSGTDKINLRVPVYYTLAEYNTAKKAEDNEWTDIDQSEFDELSDSEKIKDYTYATVKITNLYSNATVDMGTGLVTPTGDIAAEETMNQPSTYFKQTTATPPADDITTTQAFTWAVVPQELKVTTGTGQSATTRMVGITITTPDNNEYYIIADLSLIKPSSVGSQAGQMHTTTAAIDRWYPNHSYTYTFTLTKKGIEAITCTLAEWVTVTGTNTNITLEN